MLREPEVCLWGSTALISKGFAYSLVSGALLGSLIVLPECMSNYSAMELVVGRFIVFGVWVAAIVLFRREIIQRIQLDGIKPWVLVALLTNVLYYLCIAISIRSLGGVFACVLMAALPMVFQKYFLRHHSGNNLTLPLLLLVGALFLLITQKFDQGFGDSSEQSIVNGLFWLLLASISWLLGTRLQLMMTLNRQDIDQSDHYLLTGLGSALALPLIFPLIWLDHPELTLFPEGFESTDWSTYGLGMLVAGILATGIARIYRSRALLHTRHPGLYPNTYLEVFFGVMFVFAVEGRTPDNQEWAVILFLVCGMILFHRSQPISQTVSASSG
ncbi:DMT family transporter [Endozoicomonas arenosclerae]|uniref:DMT family transporter n=1 Tax=Endozoicomonas arenosclerae TaxID=1633495 RepID=UPI00078115EA|nr:DMT family transporter [Endozoicomonas arenosclerae]